MVDNNSEDNTVAWLQEHESHVVLIKNTENRGFTGAQNQAMRLAMEHGAEFVMLLNHDTMVAPGCVRELLRVAQLHASAAAVQPLIMLYESNPERVNSWGNAQHYLGFGYAGGYQRLVSDAPKEIMPISYASGAAVLYRISALQKIGLFPEHFFMYQEDLDISWRMRLAGYEILLAPAARVYHKYDWQGAAKKYALVERNRLATVYANYHWATVIALLPGFLLAEIGLLSASFFTGWWRKKIEAYRLLANPFYRQAMRDARSHAQSLRCVSDRTTTAPLTAIIDFQETSSTVVRYILNPAFWLYWKFVRMFMFW